MTVKKFCSGFKDGMGIFGQNIALIINTFLLSIVYILGVGITSIIAKIVGKSFLETKKKKESYWVELNLRKKEMEEYYRQF